MLEIARFWGHYSKLNSDTGRYEIHGNLFPAKNLK